MKHLLAAFTLSLLASSAYAAPARDFSMGVDESLQNSSPGNYQAPQGINTNTYQPQQQRRSLRDEFPSLEGDSASRGSSHYMDNYCDPSTKIGIARTSVSDCLSDKRKAVCDEYQAVTADVARVLNLTIDCQFAAGEAMGARASDEEEETGIAPIAMPVGCDTTAEKRIVLLKKYHDDAYATHALLFLPDMAIKGGNSCISGGR